MILSLPHTSALSACNGVVIDIEKNVLDGTAARNMAERGFEELEKTGARNGALRLGIREVFCDNKVALDVSDGTKMCTLEVGLEDLKIGGNTLNTAIAASEVERLMTGETGGRMYGPLNGLQEKLIHEKTRLQIANSLKTHDQMAAMPSRISVGDPVREKYLRGTPDFENRTREGRDLRFLVENGVLIPTTNGDLILSSCINSKSFWKQVRDYLKSNPDTTLYFQPGGVHLKKLVENESYLPEDLMGSGRIIVILNVDEMHGFAENLASQDIAEVRPVRDVETTVSNAVLTDEKETTAINIARELAKRGLHEVVITNGPGSIISYKSEAGKDKVFVTSPADRTKVNNILRSVGIENPSKAVLSIGCGDTFTGAFITLSKLYPDADRIQLMEVASMFGTIQTHNPNSNIGNLNLQALREYVIDKLGKPNPREFSESA